MNYLNKYNIGFESKEYLPNKIYLNCYRRNHSKFLTNYFNLSENGIDYYNSFNIGFEFKECFSNKREFIRFKIPLKQVKLNPYFVFCYANKEYYIVKATIFRKYSFNNGYCTIRLSTIKNFAFFRTFDIFKLKDKIESIKELIK